MNTQELFNQIQSRLILDLNENEVPCSKCKGLRFVYSQTDDKGYIDNCTNCYNGRLYKCKYCGKLNITDWCDCSKACEERDNAYNKKQLEENQNRFDKAEKISYKYYDGYFLFEGEEYIYDLDAIYDWLYEKIKYEKLTDGELPKYLWATKSEPLFALDIKDIVYNKCEDGYEGMYDNLNTEDELLSKAQEYLDKWNKKQGDRINIYYEDYSKAIMIEELIREIREDIGNE